MLRSILILVLLTGVSCLTAGFAGGTEVTQEQATRVAETFIASVVAENGGWADSPSPRVAASGRIQRLGLHLGYWIDVDPAGVVIVGRLQELAPILAYSEKGQYLPDQSWGFLAFVEDDHLDLLETIAAEHGPLENLTLDDSVALTGTDWPALWSLLASGQRIGSGPAEPLSRDYVPGTSMLTTEWSQTPPYNLHCPDLGCNYGDYGFPAQYDQAWAGCVPVAAAQIMNYWAWPPLAEDIAWFDWNITSSEYQYQDWNDTFIDQDGNPVSEANLYTLASLIAAIGDLAGSDYGCDGTSTARCDTPGRDMLDAYEDHFYFDDDANCDIEGIGNDFNVLVGELNANRPVQYGSDGHSVVVDGWNLWGGVTEQVHIVYGHGGTSSGWWTMQSWLDRKLDRTDGYIKQVKPIGCQGTQLPGGNQNAGPGIASYRYADRDAIGSSTIYRPGINLQVLGGVRLAAEDGSSNYVRFEGDPNAGGTTFVFSRTKSHGGARVDRGAIKLLDGGGLRVH